MSTTDIRAAFEEWAKREDGGNWDETSFFKTPDGNYEVSGVQEYWVTWQAATEAAKDIGLAAPNEPKPCRACDPSVGFICEEHGESEAEAEADAYNYACELMEQGWKERAKRGVEIGTEGSLCDGIAWIFDRMKKLEAEAAKATGTAVEQTKQLFKNLEELRDKWKIVDGDMREGDSGLITHHLAAFMEGLNFARAEAARQPAPVVTCTCPGGDGSLRWPCPQHPPLPVAITDKTGPNGIKWYVEPNLPDGVNLYIKEHK